jgi:probable phosphoglycerate mutase
MAVLRILVVQPGATEFDEQGRAYEVARTVGELADLDIERIYTSPCQSARQTAAALADGRVVKVKRLADLKNLDHGLWHGKLISEVKQTQPKAYRRWRERPETICPPQGESVDSARRRVRDVLLRLLKKHKDGVVALVVGEPLASFVRSHLVDRAPGDLWKAECDRGAWELIEIEREKVGA